MSDFEKVHTMTDYYDGPRGGVADYLGKPHVYKSIFDDKSGYSDVFRLSPIADAVFQLALEDWAIWLRWETAFHSGEASRETHPALPIDRQRHDELQKLLANRLSIDPGNCVTADGNFRVQDGTRQLEVCWSPIESNE